MANGGPAGVLAGHACQFPAGAARVHKGAGRGGTRSYLFRQVRRSAPRWAALGWAAGGERKRHKQESGQQGSGDHYGSSLD